MKKIIYTSLFAILLTSMAYSEYVHEEHKGHSQPLGVESLSYGLRSLLSQEMKALQGGMTSIIPAYVSGNWEAIEETAGKMKNSYIFKQHLTKKQAKELYSVLPEAFIEKDKNFHYLAKMLGHAANKKKPELVNFYYSEMLEACVGCHTQFATHKFSNLVIKNNNGHSH